MQRLADEGLHRGAVKSLPGSGHPYLLAPLAAHHGLAHLMAAEEHQNKGLRAPVSGLGRVVLDPHGFGEAVEGGYSPAMSSAAGVTESPGLLGSSEVRTTGASRWWTGR